MGTNQNTKNHAARNDVLPCVSPGKVPRLPPQVAITDRSWPFLGSFAVHAVLVAIISCPALQYPITVGSQSPNIIWFSTASLPDSSEETESLLHGPSVAFAAQQEASMNESSRQPPASPDGPVSADYQENAPEQTADTTEPALTIAAPMTAKRTIEKIKTLKPPHENPPRPAPVSTPLPKPAPIPVLAKIVTIPLEAEPESPQALPAIQPAMTKVSENRSFDEEKSQQNEDDRKSREIIEQNQLAVEELRREQIILEQELRANQEKTERERERVAAEKARLKQQAADKLRRAKELLAIQNRLDLERTAAEKARQKKLASEIELQKRKNLEEALHKQETEHVARAKAEQNLSAGTRQNKPAPQQHKKTPETQSPVKAAEKTLSLPLVKGDFKLVITGPVPTDTTITFTDFARSRWSRPFSRAESLRKTKIVPIVATTRNNSREVVIARANPGIYTVTAESAGEPANVTLTLKLYEETTTAVTRELGKHTIARKKVLLKILMPDGILWDDDAAFSGNMEDSEGVTKFNTETGLMWKEYTE